MPLGWLIYVLVSLIVIILLIQLLVNLLDRRKEGARPDPRRRRLQPEDLRDF